MQSLRTRLLLGLILSLSLVFTVQWLVARVAIRDQMEGFVEHELVEDTAELLQALDVADGKPQNMSLKQVDPAFLTPMSGHYYQIMVDGVKVFTSPSLGAHDLRTSMLRPGEAMRGHGDGPNGQLILVGSKGSLKDGHQVTIQIGMGLAHIDETIKDFLWRFSLISLAMILLSLLLQNWIVSRSLSVLGTIKTDIARVAAGDLQRLDEKVPMEVYPLVSEINLLSDTLSLRLKRSREALGNLAHALKTPLSLLMQSASNTASPDSSTSMHDQLGVLTKRIDYELKRARLAGACNLDSPIVLKPELDALIHAMSRLHHDKHLNLELQLRPELRVRGDKEDLMELFGNLLDNACKFARSHVLLTIADQTSFDITVEDDGPGCDADELKRIAERGVRLDESKQGHGLGLSIVADIVESYSGKLSFSRSENMGGLCVKVTLPAGIVDR